MGEGDQVREHQAGVIPPWTFHNFPFREWRQHPTFGIVYRSLLSGSS